MPVNASCRSGAAAQSLARPPGGESDPDRGLRSACENRRERLFAQGQIDSLPAGAYTSPPATGVLLHATHLIGRQSTGCIEGLERSAVVSKQTPVCPHPKIGIGTERQMPNGQIG